MAISLQRYHKFWVHGNSEETFKASFIDISQRLGLSQDASESSRLDKVKSWLESRESGEWLMIVDNLDHFELDSDTTKQIKKYLPQRRGAILFTTRNRNVIGHPAFVPSARNGVEVEKMDTSEALLTFQNYVGASDTDQNTEATMQLLEHLDNLPLAIAQAGAYIRTMHISVAQYLQDFERSEQDRHRLLSKPLGTTPGDIEKASRGAMTTWSITFETINKQSPNSIRLLQIMSLLSSEAISNSLLMEAIPLLNLGEHIPFEEVLAPLINFAILTVLETSDISVSGSKTLAMYRMHRLFSLWTRTHMDPKVKLERLETAIEALSIDKPVQLINYIPKCRRLLPHIFSILEYAEDYLKKPFAPAFWDLQLFLGGILFYLGDIQSALHWCQSAYSGLNRALGEAHNSTISALYSVGIMFESLERFDEALNCLQHALQLRSGRLDSLYFSILHETGSIFIRQRKFDKALTLLQQCLESRESTLGHYDPRTLETVFAIGEAFRTQEPEHFDMALKYYERALHGIEKAGKNYPTSTEAAAFRISITSAMAWIFSQQGNHEEALGLYKVALDGAEKIYGENHKDTIRCLYKMACSYRRRGYRDDLLRALELFQRSYSAYASYDIFGKDHPYTIRAAYGIRETNYQLGEIQKTSQDRQPPREL